MRQETQNWPAWDFEPFTYDEPETTTKQVQVHSATIVVHDCSNSTPFEMNLEKYSTLQKVLWVTATCQKAIQKLRKTAGADQPVTVQDLAQARLMWERSIQKQTFPQLIQKVEKGQKHEMSQIGLFVDSQGLIRCKGRLGKSDMDYDCKYPKLLPKRHRFTDLGIQECHKQCGHRTASHTLAQVRKEYWITSGRACVTRVTSKCVTCKKANGQPFALPPMPELPETRILKQACFKNTGVDYFGPVKIKTDTGITKCWVALFTCLATRAIHLELVMDLSAKEFLMALRRFISRRGKPTTIVSDNGPQFKLTAEAVEDDWIDVTHDKEVSRFATENGIQWTFITPYAPYMGGVYERMVGIVKTGLRKTVGQAMMTAKQFKTCLSECEAVVNTRPLAHVSSEFDRGEVITPAHFLTMNPIRVQLLIQWKPKTP